MDTLSGYDEGRGAAEHATDHGVSDPNPAIGNDERRMHVRAYNHWVSLLKGRPYPSIADLDPASLVDFGPQSVLIDFTRSTEDPGIAYLGRALRDECGLDNTATSIAAVPSRSLLSRLTDHYLQIIANRAPIGFEAEFVGTRGNTMLYRGILMPLSSNGDGIDFIYGVINWKEMVDTATQATLDVEVDAAVRTTPKTPAAAPAWADGPSAGAPTTDASIEGDDLTARLTLAQASATAAANADTRSRSFLYRALGLSHEFALATQADPDGYRRLLEDAGIKLQHRAPMTGIVKLVFGADYDKTRLTEFAAVLTFAQRTEVSAGDLAAVLETTEGGIKGIVQAERALRRPAAPADRRPDAVEQARGRPSLASVALPTSARPGALVLLVARAASDGVLEVVGEVTDEALTARAAARIAA